MKNDTSPVRSNISPKLNTYYLVYIASSLLFFIFFKYIYYIYRHVRKAVLSPNQVETSASVSGAGKTAMRATIEVAIIFAF